MPERMSREALSKKVAEEIAKALPKEFVAVCIEEAIRECITDFKVEPYTLQALLKEAVLEKAKELLRTRYTTAVEAEADKLAQQALSKARLFER